MPFAGDQGTTPPLALTSNNLDYTNAWQGPFTVIPVACTLKAVYAALTHVVGDTTPIAPSVSLTVWKNSAPTDFPSCTADSATPISCALPAAPLTLTAGETLSYVITVPDNNSGVLNTTLVCE